MTVGLQRANTLAITEEVTPGDYVAPSVGGEFVPLRPGNELSYEPEQLENDELLNDIGASKSATGKEIVSGSHSAYLRHSGVEGQEPELSVLYESVMGAKNITATERDTVVGSTVSDINVDAGEGVEFPMGKAVLVKNGSGFEIRNVDEVSGDSLSLNFRLDNAPGTGINLGKAVTYIPAAQGHPTFSTTKYLGGGFAKEVSAGNTATEVSITMDANGYGEVEFSFEGTKYFFNPITISANNKFLDFEDDQGVSFISIAERIYKTPIELADAITAAFDSATTETIVCSFSSETGKFTISTSTSSVLELPWNTGANTVNSIGATLGFIVASDDTGAVSYVSDNEQSYASSITPSYDNADPIIVKGAELFIGNETDNVCICAQTVSITISKEVEDVDCICEESGIKEKIPTSRSAEMTVTAVLKKHDVTLLDALLKNARVQAMMNAGPKTGGNWVPGKCFNVYFQNATVSQYTTTGDSFIQASITLKGYVTSTKKDVYLNFV
jgi:hypothetical protein